MADLLEVALEQIEQALGGAALEQLAEEGAAGRQHLDPVHRLRVLADGYGLDADERAALVDVIAAAVLTVAYAAGGTALVCVGRAKMRGAGRVSHEVIERVRP